MAKKTVVCHLTLLFVLVWTTAAQTTRPDTPSLSYGFVSPNTTEGLKLHEAAKALNSKAEARLIQSAANLGCRTHVQIRMAKALGSWSDGAENSLLLQMTVNESTLRFVVASLGLDTQQKAVLYFQQRRPGTATLYILRLAGQRKTLSSLARVLDRSGIEYRTIVPLRTRTLIYVVDLKRELGAKVGRAARALRARLQVRIGSAEFIGDDTDRQRGKVAFEREIDSYEKNHPELPRVCSRVRNGAR